MLDLLGIAKKEGWSREKFLQMAAQIEGVYVPSLYDITYHEDGTVAAITPKTALPRPSKSALCRILIRLISPKTLWYRLSM